MGFNSGFKGLTAAVEFLPCFCIQRILVCISLYQSHFHIDVYKLDILIWKQKRPRRDGGTKIWENSFHYII